MPGASMNEIKGRIKSIGNTMQITRAMELVATSKLRRARKDAEAADEFCRVYGRTVVPVLAADECFMKRPADGDLLYIVIAGDRGLAGGFNSAIFRLLEAASTNEKAIFTGIGKKTVEYLARNEKNLYYDGKYANAVDMKYCSSLAKVICEGFRVGKLARVELIYTEFDSMLSQTPRQTRLLPIKLSDIADELSTFDVITDGDIRELAKSVIPEYIACEIRRGVCRSIAAESAARRNAMSSANKSAEEMINSLTLNYNRARQALITQEITEIVSGTGAL